MSLTLVNSSNHDNEDYAVLIDGKCKILKSTEMVHISPNQKLQDIYPVSKSEADRPKPYYDKDGHQLLPHVEVVLKKTVAEPMTEEEIEQFRHTRGGGAGGDSSSYTWVVPVMPNVSSGSAGSGGIH